MKSPLFTSTAIKLEQLLPKIIIGLVAAVVVTGLGTALLTAFFGVPMGDDYLAIKTYSDKTTWLNEAWYSLTTTGRYLQSITASVSYGILGDNIATVLPAIVIVWLYILLVAYIRLANQFIHQAISSAGVYTAAAVLLFIIMSAGRPDGLHSLWFSYQIFFFSAAIVTYTLCVLLYLSGLLFVLNSKWLQKRSLITQGVAIFIAAYILGLYNEVVPVTAAALASFAFVGIAIRARRSRNKSTRRSLVLLGSAVGASTLSVLTMYFSPASIARRNSLQQAANSTDVGLAESVVQNTIVTIGNLMLRPSDILLVAIVSVSFYTLFINHTKISRKLSSHTSMAGLLLFIAGLFAVILSLILLSVGYGPATAILARTMFIPQLLLYIGVSVAALGIVAFLWRIAHKPHLRVSILLFALLGGLVITPHHIRRSAIHLTHVQDYNAAWHSQDETLRNHAQSNPAETIYIEDAGAGIGDGFSAKCTGPAAHSTIWLTDVMEAYYGVKEICSKSDVVGE